MPPVLHVPGTTVTRPSSREIGVPLSLVESTMAHRRRVGYWLVRSNLNQCRTRVEFFGIHPRIMSRTAHLLSSDQGAGSDRVVAVAGTEGAVPPDGGCSDPSSRR